MLGLAEATLKVAPKAKAAKAAKAENLTLALENLTLALE